MQEIVGGTHRFLDLTTQELYARILSTLEQDERAAMIKTYMGRAGAVFARYGEDSTGYLVAIGDPAGGAMELVDLGIRNVQPNLEVHARALLPANAACYAMVLNSTPEPDGTRKLYSIRIPPPAAVSGETYIASRHRPAFCADAIAWSFGFALHGFRLDKET